MRIMAGIGAYVVDQGDDHKALCAKLTKPLHTLGTKTGLNQQQLTRLLHKILKNTDSAARAFENINTAHTLKNRNLYIEIFKLTAERTVPRPPRTLAPNRHL